MLPWLRGAAWAAIGLVLAGLAATVGPVLAAALDEVGAGFGARALLRSAIAVALLIPWLAPMARRSPISTAPAAIGLLVAIALPLSYASRMIETRTAEAASHLETGRTARAHAALALLCELGSWRRVAGAEPAEARQSARDELDRLRRAVSRRLPERAPASARVERGFALIRLDRTREAELLLRPLAGSVTDTDLLLASLARDDGRRADCAPACRGVLAAAAADSDQLVMAFDGLADGLHGSGRSGEVAAVYAIAARRLPRRAGYFAMQTGRHELDAGRPAAALAALAAAGRLDPSLGPGLEPLLRQVRVRTPACLLSRGALGTASPENVISH